MPLTPPDPTILERFEAALPFGLDDFQRNACDAIASGRGVLVSAPTGAGKTVVGEFAIDRAMTLGKKSFYTTPVKALSNQKYADLCERYGEDRVGLLTGDNSINGEAPVVVMTTEVLRNMLYEASATLSGLGVVILDEVHYLQDTYRGATWEEVLIHLDPAVQVVSLSATVANAHEFGDWIASVRGPVDVIVETERPVPIEHLMMIGDRLLPMFIGDEGKPNPELARMDARAPRDRDRGRGRRGGRGRGRSQQGSGGPRFRADRVEVVELLDDEDLLPCIVFIFSRAGCDAAVQRCLQAGIRLTEDDERDEIDRAIQARAETVPAEDLAVLGFDQWAEALRYGIAAHHAGLIPLFKETVEELFTRALVKVVFATETLALGINMPAKTVAIERLIKFNGERHELMTPTDFLQLTGRAGRRGKDPIGYGVTLFQSDVPFSRIAHLAEGRPHPISSSFRPSYNIAVNILRGNSIEESERLLNLSFGQFLIDRSVVKQQHRIERNERFIEGYRERADCDLGDVAEYWARARDVRRVEREDAQAAKKERTARIADAFDALRRGSVIEVERGPRSGLAAIVEVRTGKRGEPQPLAILEDGRLGRLQTRDFREPPSLIGRVEVPDGNPRSPSVKNQIVLALASLEPHEPKPLGRRAAGGPARADAPEITKHPVFDCPDRVDHERWLERIDSLEAETATLRRRVEAKTGSLARTFGRVRAVLERFGYLDGGTVTEAGLRLARIYNESDLLVAEAISAGVFDDLTDAETAAVASTLVFETRSGDPIERFASVGAGDAFTRIRRIYRTIAAAEEEQRLALVREPDPGFARALALWAGGADLEDVLADMEMSPGDFVRSTKQVWDLLQQLEDLDVSPGQTKRFRDAARSIYRGVVAYAGVL